MEFELDDIEDEWCYSMLFDFIHARWIYSCFEDVSSIISKSYKGLTPGGFLEIQDLVFPSEEGCGNGAFRELMRYIITGSTKLGKDFQASGRYKSLMETVGFEDIQVRYFVWPIYCVEKEFYLLARSIQDRSYDSSLDVEEMISAANQELIAGLQVSIQM